MRRRGGREKEGKGREGRRGKKGRNGKAGKGEGGRIPKGEGEEREGRC